MMFFVICRDDESLYLVLQNIFLLNFFLERDRERKLYTDNYHYKIIEKLFLVLGLKAQQKYTISGFVQDAASGEQLLGVNIIYKDNELFDYYIFKY